nr:hypothetical protein [Tanacetum cinerariifolium]
MSKWTKSKAKRTQPSTGMERVTDTLKVEKIEAKRTKPGTRMKRVQEIKAADEFISNLILLIPFGVSFNYLFCASFAEHILTLMDFEHKREAPSVENLELASYS